MLAASDDAILAHAAASGQVIVTADTDFGELLPDELEEGAVVSLARGKLRGRPLPVRRD